MSDNRTKAELQKRIQILEEKVAELETIANNIHAGVELCEFDEWFTITYISEGFTTLSGYTLEELKTAHQARHTALIHPDDLAAFVQSVHSQLQTTNIFSIEYRLIRKNGEISRVSESGKIIQLQNGAKGLQCTIIDITERKKLEEELEFCEKRYQIAMQVSDITMFEYNIVTRELILYENTARMYGITKPIPNGPETLIKKGIIESESAPAYLEMYRKIHAGEPVASCYVKTRGSDDVVHDFELILTTLFDSRGKPVRAVGVRKNIYEMMELQKEKDFGKNLISDKTLIFEADISSDKIISFNKEWKEKTRVTEEMSFTVMILKISQLVAPEHKQLIREKLFPERLRAAFKKGQASIVFDYKFLEKDNSYSWYEAFVSIIRDRVTGNIGVRFYHTDISETKIKSQRMLEEKQMYESVLSEAKLAYEVNITHNTLLKGHEKWPELYNIQQTDNYDDMIFVFAEKKIHPEDRSLFTSTLCSKNLLRKFNKGESRESCEYKRLENDDNYLWASCTIHLYEELETGDIKGFAYITDIDEQKRAELALKYKADHDVMTGVFNKSTAEKKIAQYLKTPEGRSFSHAFLIVDIDYFKTVNDTFGHQFGDAVITEIAVKIKSLFRKQDIIGRVGGDEFCILIKKIESVRIVQEKAAEICKNIRHTYEQDKKSCTISASLGIALYKEHGTIYAQLFQHADSALYLAKKNGRNCFEFFQKV